MANRSNQKIEPGDEVTLRVIVTSVWDNGLTVQIRSSGQNVMLPNESDIEEAIKPEPVGRDGLIKRAKAAPVKA